MKMTGAFLSVSTAIGGVFFALVPAPAWEPAAGLTQMPIWPGKPPDSRPYTGPEVDKIANDHLIAGKPYQYVNNVSKPTFIVYPARGKNTGAAVMIYPGGGYQILAIDLEGTEVCDWLTSKGVTCILVKYRVPGENKLPKSGHYPDSPEALEDCQRALRVVRSRAAEWHIDPHKIGVLGFSAGGHLSAAMGTHFNKQIYKPIDEIDKVSCRPDFCVVVYTGHIVYDENDKFVFRTDMTPPKNTSPMFIVQAENDPVDPVENSLFLFSALRKARIPAEMHLYAEGGHAFGLRKTKYPITEWPQLVEKWLVTIGMIPS